MTTTYRYWGWLLLKIGVATVLTAGIYAALRNTLFRMEPLNGKVDVTQITFDGVLFGFWILPMVWVGLVWLCVYDQRYRCRTCARRLRMPVDHGSYSALLLDHPGVEYVCPYGHGKLLVELWVPNQSASKWTKFGDIWQELFKKPAD